MQSGAILLTDKWCNLQGQEVIFVLPCPLPLGTRPLQAMVLTPGGEGWTCKINVAISCENLSRINIQLIPPRSERKTINR